MSQSRTFTDHTATIEIKVNTRKEVILTIDDIDFSNPVYESVISTLKVWKPDGTIITSKDGELDRENSTVTLTIPELTEVGNWEGEIEFRDGENIINHSQTFNFNILRSF